jgi:hypothetical protein
LLLLDYPVTDDEYGVRFGGQVLALGHLMTPILEPRGCVPHLYLYVRDGLWTSFDWAGVLLGAAVAEATGLGPLVYALVAAVPAVCVGLVAGYRLGKPWALLAIAIAMISPMGWALSMSTHAHVLSRGFLALALLFYVLALSSRRPLHWLLCGLTLAIAFSCRPFESVFLAAPFGIHLVWRALRRDGDALRACLYVAAGSAAPLALFALYSWALTGNPLLPPRFAPGRIAGAIQHTMLERVGINMGFNFFRLAIFFMGPAGLLLVALGVMTDAFTRLLGLSVVSVLALALFHNNTGIHIVGPIHYSECVVPLTVLAVYGAYNLRAWLHEHGLSFAVPASALVFVLVLELGTFNALHGSYLRRQAAIQDEIYGWIAHNVDTSEKKAVLLAPRFGQVWAANPEYMRTGAWVFEWRRPRPDYSDDVLILHNVPGFESAFRQHFPDRRFYQLVVSSRPYGLSIEELP